MLDVHNTLGVDITLSVDIHCVDNTLGVHNTLCIDITLSVDLHCVDNILVFTTHWVLTLH